MKKIKLLICDDSENVLNGLRGVLQKSYKDTIEIETSRMPVALLEKWKVSPGKMADIVLMDIEYPYEEINGIEIAAGMQKINTRLKVIFITGKPIYAQDIFEVNPSNFLVKPIDEMRLKDAIDKVIRKIEEENEDKSSILLRQNGGTIRIPIRDIRYIESIAHNTIFHLKTHDIHVRMKLSECEELLPRTEYIRTHQSYIVKLPTIKKLEKNSLELIDHTILPVARSKYQTIKNRLYDEMEGNINN